MNITKENVIFHFTMILTAHVALGLAAASKIGNPALSWPTSFGLHFLSDLVPHWDPLTGSSRDKVIAPWRWLLIILDIVLGLSLGLFFVLRSLWLEQNPYQAVNFLGACFFSVLPDLLEFPYVLLGKSNCLSCTVLSLQKKMHIKMALPWGLLPQLVILAAAVWVVL